MIGQLISPFDLSWALSVGGGLLVLCSLAGPLIIKQCKRLLWCLARTSGFSQYASTNTRTATVSVPGLVTGQCWPMPPLETPEHSQASLAQSLVGRPLLSPGSWCTQRFVCALQEYISPVLWKFCKQNPLTFKVKFLGGSQSICWIPRLGNLLRALELSQQCKNFFGLIVLLSMGHLLSGSKVGLMLISSKRTHAAHWASQDCCCQSLVPVVGHC